MPLALLACGPSGPALDASTDLVVSDAPCSRGAATLVMGSGTGPTTAGFRPLSDGDSVFLTPGPQGGQHIWIGLRGSGFDPTQPLVTLKAWRDDGALIGQIRVRLRFSPVPDQPNTWALPAQTLIIDDDRYCGVLQGRVRVTAEISDGAGRCLQEERTVRVDGIDPTALEIDRTARLNCCTQYLRRCYPAGPPDGAVPTDTGVDASLDGG
ncbi:MAG: hypothetical protein U0325_08485 [Polyangiales bacterium]